MAKPKPYVPGVIKTPNQAYLDAVEEAYNRFPTASPPPLTHNEEATGGTTYVPPSGSSSSSSSSTPPPAPDNPPLDWHAYLTNWGFDQEIVNELDRIFRTYNDPNQASAAAIAYIRGTDWYKVTFPGIQEAMKMGIVSNEADYRQGLNQVNDLYHRYYGRDVTATEYGDILKKGFTPGREGAFLQGEAFVKANRGDIQQLMGSFGEGELNDTQLQSLGEEKTGLDSALGQELQNRLAKAQQRYQGIFQGVLASPAFRLLNNGRIAAPSLSGGINPSDVSA